jgi:hypothetical protein
MLREKDLCPSPPECPYVLMEEPLAGPSALPCPQCPALLLSEYLASPGGLLIQAVLAIDFALQAGISVPLERILYPEFLLLRQLAEERNRYQAEEMKKGSKRT